MLASILNASIRTAAASPEAALGISALTWASRAVSGAAATVAIFMAPWYIGWLMALVIAILAFLAKCMVVNATSDAAFESAGVHIGKGISAVCNLFNRKTIAA